MDNIDDSEKNAKISDSAYSNSCSNSQSRTSYSCKSTHSGSNSSGSSGYGGKHFTSGSSCNNLNKTEKRCNKKDGKKKNSPSENKIVAEGSAEVEQSIPEEPPAGPPIEEKLDVALSPEIQIGNDEITKMEESISDKGTVKNEMGQSHSATNSNQSVNMIVSRPGSALTPLTCDGFSCVISMLDGIVMYTTSSLITSLGYPKDMWVGRSFIDFIHPRDRDTFASQITNRLTIPKNASEPQGKVPCLTTSSPSSTMFCRIRKYRGIQSGFSVKEKVVVYNPFQIKLTLKNINEEEAKLVYLVIQATPVFSAFKTPNEVMINPVPFVMRHLASGALDYIDSESVPFLGFLPQDIMDKDVLQLYHNDDLNYLRQVYSLIVKEGAVPRSKPFRMMAQNGDYVTFETEWSSFINPWSRKLEFVIGKHHVVEGPTNPNVFQSPEPEKPPKRSEEEKMKAQSVRESIMRIIDEVLTKPAEAAKQQMTKRCQDLASFIESLLEDQPKTEEELRLEIQDPDHSYYERDSVMIGEISPHHDFNDSKSSTETPLSYNQLNYNETLQRYFDSHQRSYVENSVTPPEDQLLTVKEVDQSGCAVTMAQYSGDSCEMSSSCESSAIILPSNELCCTGDYLPLRLTKVLIQKHNSEMEKEFVKKHREHKSSSKSERTPNKTRQKKKEHLARCNASFQPTSAGISAQDKHGNHGIKRSSKQSDMKSQPEQKHHCSNRPRSRKTAAPIVQSLTNNILGPVYSRNNTQLSMDNIEPLASTSKQVQQKQPAMQYMMYGQAIPFVYSPENSFISSNMQNVGDNTGINAMTIGSNHEEPHGTKRGATLGDNLQTSHKHHCAYSRQSRPRHKTPILQAQPQSQMTMNPTNNVSNVIPGMGIPQQMQMISPVASMQGMFPLYYAQSTSSTPPTTTVNSCKQSSSEQNAPTNMQYMMYGQAVIGSPFMFSPVSPQMAFLLQQSLIDQTVQFSPTSQLQKSPFEQKIRASSTLKIAKSHQWREKKRAHSQATSSFSEQENSNHFCSSTNALKRVSGVNNDNQCDGSNSPLDTSESKSVAWPKSTEAVPDASIGRDGKKILEATSDDAVDRTDGESSYSSFYSSFFKTESGSAQESVDAKSSSNNKNARFGFATTSNQTQTKKFIKRKLEPQWMEQVSVTSDLIYKYQIITKSLDEILLADKAKISSFEQPSLVNEQLNQLYLDLQLEGVAAKLTLEEGITSSSSSGEETCNATAASRKKREYSKLVMIYEEDAPLPPPDPKDNLPLITRSGPAS